MSRNTQSTFTTKGPRIGISTQKNGGQSLQKRHRQRAILDLLARRPVTNQAQLVLELAKMNFRVTQATISRDINELNLIKSSQGYICPDPEGEMERLLDLNPAVLLRMSVTWAETVSGFVVVHTVGNMARYAASVLDEPVFEGVVGTIADRNTVLVVTHCPEDAKKVKDKIDDLIRKCRKDKRPFSSRR